MLCGSRYRTDFKEVGHLGNGSFSKVRRRPLPALASPLAVRRRHSAAACVQAPKADLPPLPDGLDGQVLRVLGRLDGCEYAVKRTARRLQSEAARRASLREVQALAAAGPHAHLAGVPPPRIRPGGDAFGGALSAPLSVGATGGAALRRHCGATAQVRYHSAWLEADHLYIQLELCRGSLADLAAQQGAPFTEPMVAEAR